MSHKPYTHQTRFGTHCSSCGSLVDACGDVIQCRIDAKFEIEEAIRKGTSEDPLVDAASQLLGEFLFFGRESL